MRTKRFRAVASAAVIAILATASPVSADEGTLPDGVDGGRLDIVAIAHRHAGDADVIHRVVFRERFAKRLLVRSFELYLEGRRGTTSPFMSPSTLVYGRTLRDDDRIFMRLYFFDVEMVTHRLADVRIRKGARSAVVAIPVEVLSTTTPFTYRWVARTEFRRTGEPTIEDQTDWLRHRIAA